jgi:hypothetical protein
MQLTGDGWELVSHQPQGQVDAGRFSYRFRRRVTF